MAPQTYITEIQRFTSGNLSLDELKEFIDSRLSELRDAPGNRDEKELLSDIAMRLYQTQSGYSSSQDIFDYLKSITLTPRKLVAG
jgi:hypothetical protein